MLLVNVPALPLDEESEILRARSPRLLPSTLHRLMSFVKLLRDENQ